MADPRGTAFDTPPVGDPRGSAFNTPPVQPRARAPKGYKYVKDPARPGKWKLVKIQTTPRPKPGTPKPGTTTTPTPAAPVASGGFVADEIARQIAQDQALTAFVDQQQAGIAGTLAGQHAEAARIAGQYQPTTVFNNPTLDEAARARVATDVGLTNQVNQDQQGALAALIANTGSAGSDLFANMRAAGSVQHRDYSRRLEGLRLELERQYRMEQEALAQAKREEARAQQQHRLMIESQRLENRLAQQRFGMDAQAQAFGQSQAAQAAAAAGAEAGKPAKGGIYGFGEDRDPLINQTIQGWQAGMHPAPNKDGTPGTVTVRQPWRDLWQGLVHNAGLNPDQSALLATRMSPDSIRDAKKGARGVVQMLRQRGVSEKVQAFIIKKYFGAETWANVSTGGAQRPANATSGTYAPGAQRPSGPPSSKPMPSRDPKPGYKWHWSQGAQAWTQIKNPVDYTPLT